jgi:hypothetical protein
MNYLKYIEEKTQFANKSCISNPVYPESMFPFQKYMVEWALKTGRAALFEDCGLGKTVQQLCWADNVVRHTNGRVLILTPLSVSFQTVQEAAKFGIEAGRIHNGDLPKEKIAIVNYEQLHKLSSHDFVGCVCDESSILKNFDGTTKQLVTAFMRKMDYRLLCTATAAPNDYIELGTSSEALGYLGYIDMLKKFFKSENGTCAVGGRTQDSFAGKFRFRGHAENDFWRWVCSWGRAIRRPSDLGFSDDGYVLPKLIEKQHIVESEKVADGFLFAVPAVGLAEQRAERSRTLEERCQMAAQLSMSHENQTVSWCHLNRESEMLKRMIPGSVEISGNDSDEQKEEAFIGFSTGQIKKLVTKPSLASFGLNWQGCNHQTFFPSHSYEQYYQAVRRSYRFGQKNDVTIDVISTEGEQQVLKNLQRKSKQAEEMFDMLTKLMLDHLNVNPVDYEPKVKASLPGWLK